MSNVTTKTIRWGEMKMCPKLESRGGTTFHVPDWGQIWMSPLQHSEAVHFVDDEELVMVNLQGSGATKDMWFFSGVRSAGVHSAG